MTNIFDRKITSQSNDTIPKKLQNLCSTIHVHDQLCDTVDILNHCFGLQYMLECGTIVIYTTVTVFSCAHYLLLGSNNSTPWSAYFSNMVWDASYFYYMITMIIFANLIKSEGERSEVLLVKLVEFEGSRKKVNFN